MSADLQKDVVALPDEMTPEMARMVVREIIVYCRRQCYAYGGFTIDLTGSDESLTLYGRPLTPQLVMEIYDGIKRSVAQGLI